MHSLLNTDSMIIVLVGDTAFHSGVDLESLWMGWGVNKCSLIAIAIF